MSAAADHHHPALAPPRPAVPNVVLGMALFLFTEVMLFAGLVSAYIVLRGQGGAWPPAGQPRLPAGVTAASTVVLIASGLCAWRAAAARRTGADGAVRKLRLATTLGGAFLLVQGWEWARLLDFGLGTDGSVYAGTFYSTIGVHALHVAAGVFALVWAECALARGKLDADGLRAVVMFWSFVVVVWPVLYAVVYLW